MFFVEHPKDKTDCRVDRKSLNLQCCSAAIVSKIPFRVFSSVGFIFTIDAALMKHSWLDFGMFLQNLMIAAQARGLATCPQVSFVRYQTVIADQLGLAPGESVVCGMSLGHADEEATLNQMAMPREPIEEFVTWYGFGE